MTIAIIGSSLNSRPPMVCWVGSLPSSPFFPHSWAICIHLQASGSGSRAWGRDSKMPDLWLREFVSSRQTGPNSRHWLLSLAHSSFPYPSFFMADTLPSSCLCAYPHLDPKLCPGSPKSLSSPSPSLHLCFHYQC